MEARQRSNSRRHRCNITRPYCTTPFHLLLAVAAAPANRVQLPDCAAAQRAHPSISALSHSLVTLLKDTSQSSRLRGAENLRRDWQGGWTALSVLSRFVSGPEKLAQTAAAGRSQLTTLQQVQRPRSKEQLLQPPSVVVWPSGRGHVLALPPPPPPLPGRVPASHDRHQAAYAASPTRNAGPAPKPSNTLTKRSMTWRCIRLSPAQLRGPGPSQRRAKG